MGAQSAEGDDNGRQDTSLKRRRLWRGGPRQWRKFTDSEPGPRETESVLDPLADLRGSDLYDQLKLLAEEGRQAAEKASASSPKPETFHAPATTQEMEKIELPPLAHEPQEGTVLDPTSALEPNAPAVPEEDTFAPSPPPPMETDVQTTPPPRSAVADAWDAPSEVEGLPSIPNTAAHTAQPIAATGLQAGGLEATREEGTKVNVELPQRQPATGTRPDQTDRIEATTGERESVATAGGRDIGVNDVLAPGGETGEAPAPGETHGMDEQSGDDVSGVNTDEGVGVEEMESRGDSGQAGPAVGQGSGHGPALEGSSSDTPCDPETGAQREEDGQTPSSKEEGGGADLDQAPHVEPTDEWEMDHILSGALDTDGSHHAPEEVGQGDAVPDTTHEAGERDELEDTRPSGSLDEASSAAPSLDDDVALEELEALSEDALSEGDLGTLDDLEDDVDPPDDIELEPADLLEDLEPALPGTDSPADSRDSLGSSVSFGSDGQLEAEAGGTSAEDQRARRMGELKEVLEQMDSRAAPIVIEKAGQTRVVNSEYVHVQEKIQEIEGGEADEDDTLSTALGELEGDTQAYSVAPENWDQKPSNETVSVSDPNWKPPPVAELPSRTIDTQQAPLSTGPLPTVGVPPPPGSTAPPAPGMPARSKRSRSHPSAPPPVADSRLPGAAPSGPGTPGPARGGGPRGDSILGATHEASLWESSSSGRESAPSNGQVQARSPSGTAAQKPPGYPRPAGPSAQPGLQAPGQQGAWQQPGWSPDSNQPVPGQPPSQGWHSGDAPNQASWGPAGWQGGPPGYPPGQPLQGLYGPQQGWPQTPSSPWAHQGAPLFPEGQDPEPEQRDSYKSLFDWPDTVDPSPSGDLWNEPPDAWKPASRPADQASPILRARIDDRRDNPRLIGPTGVVYFRRQGRIATGDLGNLSAVGAMVRTRTPVAPGTTVPTSLELPGLVRPIRLMARVVYVRRVQLPSGHEVAAMGIAFEQMETEDHRILMSFLSRFGV